VLCALAVQVVHADIWDLTDSAHPVLLSSASAPSEEDYIQYVPSYDCRKAQSKTEKMICSDEQLAADDRKLALIYKALSTCLPKEKMAPIRQAQRQWLHDRGTCASYDSATDDDSPKQMVTCLGAAFNVRINALQTMVDQCSNDKSIALMKNPKVYTNTLYGFSINYPPFMEASKEFRGYYLLSKNVWEQGDGVNVVRISVKNPEKFYDTEEVRIGIRPGNTETTACENIEGSTTETIHGHIFHVTEREDNGMSHFLTSEEYRTFYNGNCYVIQSFRTGSSASEPTEEQRHAPSLEIVRHQIVQSFQFLK